MKHLPIIICILLMLTSCRTQTVVLPERHTEYIHDTVIRADSVYVSHYLLQRGDTIWMTDTVLKYIYRDKVVEVTQHDSIPYPVEIPIEVPTPVPRFYIRCTIGFWLIIIGFILYIAARLYLRR